MSAIRSAMTFFIVWYSSSFTAPVILDSISLWSKVSFSLPLRGHFSAESNSSRVKWTCFFNAVSVNKWLIVWTSSLFH
jgi:hypothetical protein